MKASAITDVIVSLLLFLFGYTAISKFLSFSSFQQVLGQIMHKTGAALLAYLIPTLEAMLVLLLLFPATRLKGLYASLLLLSLFTVYLLAMLFIAPKLPCSCGGVISGMGWKEHVAFNLFFIGLAVAGIRSCKVGSACPGTSPG